MKTVSFVLIFILGTIFLESCSKDEIDINSFLFEIDKTKYYDSEVLNAPYTDIYGIWEIYDISGGLTGDGYEINFDYLEVKPFGIYGFINEDELIEFGKIVPTQDATNETDLLVEFTKDEESGSFFGDPEKYIQFSGKDTLHLMSPCCDRYNYHFERIK